MTKEEKLHKLLDWYSEIKDDETKRLAPQDDFDRINQIENLIGESLPQDILDLYNKHDGDTGDGYGSFFGHSFVSLSEMINSLDFAKSQVKPESPKETNPEKSNRLIEQIIQLVIKELPLKKKLGLIKRKWFKVEFQTGPGSFGGPYLYSSKNTSDTEREIVELSDNTQKKISQLTEELHDLEIQDYNWDTLDITAYEDGQNSVDRKFYDLGNTLPLTSNPEGAIKKKYFHIKWIPIISDYGGNYIGIDLDPDIKGTKGQVIIFGRDEEDMFVLANSWGEFLDWNLTLINNNFEKLLSESHLHDTYKQIKSA